MAASWMQRAADRLSTHETLHGIDVALFLATSQEERSLILAKVGSALDLVATHAPHRFAALRRDLRQILVCGPADAAARYDPDRRLCELYVDWVNREDISAEMVAAAIVHEAEHARLWRIGFRYVPELQERIERICHRAERIFGKRLPTGAQVVAQAEAGMQLDAHFYSREERTARKRRAIRQLAQGSFLVWPLLWFYDLRTWLRGPEMRRGRPTRR
jgi:hypothetical protein